VCFLGDEFDAKPLSISAQLGCPVEVTAYIDDNYNGDSTTFKLEPRSCFVVPDGWNRKISSAKIKDNKCVTYYTDSNCLKNPLHVCGDIDFYRSAPLYNDNVYSILPDQQDLLKCLNV
ncbi:3255_t:CDS:1, partial [Ambispora leptoticha]